MAAQKGKDLLLKVDLNGFWRSRRWRGCGQADRLQQRDGGHHRRGLARGANCWPAAGHSKAVKGPASSRTPRRTRRCGRASSTARSSTGNWWCRNSARSKGRRSPRSNTLAAMTARPSSWRWNRPGRSAGGAERQPQARRDRVRTRRPAAGSVHAALAELEAAYAAPDLGALVERFRAEDCRLRTY